MSPVRATLQAHLPAGVVNILRGIRDGLRLSPMLFHDGLLRLRCGSGAPRKYQLLFVPPGDIGIGRVGGVGRLRQIPERIPTVVAGGDWDRAETPNPHGVMIFSAVEKRIVEGVSWQEAGEVDRMLAMVARRGSFDGCKSLEDIERRNRKLDVLIDFVRSRRTLLSRREMSGSEFREREGIAVTVTRDGRLLLGHAGTHRLAIAQTLGAPVIPVAIVLVHAECLENGVWASLVARSRRLATERAALLAEAPGGAAQDRVGVSGR